MVDTKGGCLTAYAVGTRQSAEVQLGTAASQLATCPQIPCRRCHPADVHPSTPRQTAAAAPHAPAAPPAPPPPDLPRPGRAARSAAASRRSARRGGRTGCRVRVLLYWRRLQQRAAWGQGKLRPQKCNRVFCPKLLPNAAGLEQPRSIPPHPPTWNSGGRFVRNQGCCCTACRLMRCCGSCGQQAGADQPQVGYRHGTLLRCRLLPHANRLHVCCSARSRAPPGTHVIATARPCAPHMKKDPADHLHTAV